jgi:hypothetical protein
MKKFSLNIQKVLRTVCFALIISSTEGATESRFFKAIKAGELETIDG